MNRFTEWMWWRKARAKRQAAIQQAIAASFWHGVKTARTEDIMAVEAVMTSLPDYARNSLKHLATVIQVLRKLEARGDQPAQESADGALHL